MEDRGAKARYLNAILTLGKKYLCVRSVDVAHYLKCSKATVSVYISRLADEGLLTKEQDGHLALTPQGASYMEEYQERSHYFQALLLAAGLDAESAEREAFAIAQAIRPETYAALRALLTI